MPGIALPLGVDLDQAAQVMQKGETGYAWHKGHDFGTGYRGGLGTGATPVACYAVRQASGPFDTERYPGCAHHHTAPTSQRV